MTELARFWDAFWKGWAVGWAMSLLCVYGTQALLKRWLK